MTDEENDAASMAECGACRAVIPIDSTECPECGTNFSGLSEEALGECGACNSLVPLDSTQCPECGVLFVADDVVDILRKWVADTGINIRKLFDKFDENSDGTIDSDELRAGLLSLNLADLPPSQVDRLVSEIDADGNGLIDLDEFDHILMGEEVPAAEDSSDSEQDDSQEHSEEPETTADEEADETSVEDEEDPSDGAMNESDADVEEGLDDEEDDAEEEDDVVSDQDEHDIEGEEFDLDDDEVDDLGEESSDEDSDEEDVSGARSPLAALSALAELMDEHDISAQRLFNELDADGNGTVSLAELRSVLDEKYGEILDEDQVETIMSSLDGDGDEQIDITEFIGSMEDYETMEELVEEKVFPSPWQKRMMSKTWNDSVWPILHVGFGILVAIFIANGMFGFVDGSGGNIAYEPNDSGLIPSGNIAEGDIYPCDEKFQKDGCRNSLTPLAGENGSLSMPTGFYWDGILFILISIIGLGTTLFLHLVKAPEWRARTKAMKEFEEAKSEVSTIAEGEDDSEDEGESIDDDEEESDEDAYEEDEESDEDAYEEDEESDEDAYEEDDEEEYADGDDDDDDDEIDIGSHIGLVFDDEEVFGKIVEFDDDEGTVTIEEDGTGDLVTGYQEDMFVE